MKKLMKKAWFVLTRSLVGGFILFAEWELLVLIFG